LVKHSRLTRVYKETDILLQQASEETNIPKVQILELVVKDALFGKRDLNEYLDKLEAEIKGIFKKK
jgi:hypothetical protein|tara:strand:+ start:9064 stop:9261 length:198 start_codon:yes stop_codon:yes gene_type:complete